MSSGDQPNGIKPPNATSKYLQLSPSTANANATATATAKSDTTATAGSTSAEDKFLRELIHNWGHLSAGKSSRPFPFWLTSFYYALHTLLHHSQVLFTLQSLFGHACKNFTSQESHQFQLIPGLHRVICAAHSFAFADCPTNLTYKELRAGRSQTNLELSHLASFQRVYNLATGTPIEEMSNSVLLTSSDNVTIQVGRLSSPGSYSFLGKLTHIPEREVIERSVLLKNMIDDLGEAATVEAIPITNVSLPSLLQFLSSLTWR